MNRQSLAELQQEIFELEKEKDELEALTRMRDNTGNVIVDFHRDSDFNETDENRSYIFRIGPFDRELLKELPDYETRWSGTIYDLHPDFCHSVISGSFRGEDLYYYIDNSIRNFFILWEPDEEYGRCTYYRFINICVVEAVMPSPKGYMLVLRDPYGTITTEPVKDIPTTESFESLSGKTVAVMLKMCRERKTAKVAVIHNLPEDGYTIENGRDLYIKMGNMYYEHENKVD